MNAAAATDSPATSGVACVRRQQYVGMREARRNRAADLAAEQLPRPGFQRSQQFEGPRVGRRDGRRFRSAPARGRLTLPPSDGRIPSAQGQARGAG
eukprot:357886-Chlamydomonas_euryale.AAC.5